MDVNYSDNIYTLTLDSEESSTIYGWAIKGKLERDLEDEIVFELRVDRILDIPEKFEYFPEGSNYTNCDTVSTVLNEDAYNQLLAGEFYSFDLPIGSVEIHIDDDISPDEYEDYD